MPGAYEKNSWLDVGTLNSINSAYPNSDLTIKAFTVSKTENDVTDENLEKIEITTPPNKTT